MYLAFSQFQFWKTDLIALKEFLEFVSHMRTHPFQMYFRFTTLCLLLQCIIAADCIFTPKRAEWEPRTHLFNLQVTSTYNSRGRRIIAVNDHNDSYGPTIRVHSGDTINLSVKNLICSPEEDQLSKTDALWKEYCFTALHFHGLTPIGNENDGVPGLTQRAILTGDTYWYNFTIPEETCGTFWYHSHSAIQYGDGFRGTVIVECTKFTSMANNVMDTLKEQEIIEDSLLMLKNEQTDSINLRSAEEQVITLSDWYKNWDLDILRERVMAYDGTTDPHIDNSLINGSEEDDIVIKLRQSTESVILRVLNTGMSGTQVFHVKGHKLVIIETDGIIVNPYVVETLTLAVGQRYTVIVKLSGDSNIKIINGCNKMMGYIEKTAWFVKDSDYKIENGQDVSIKALPGLNQNELYKDLEPIVDSAADINGIWGGSEVEHIALDYIYHSDDETKAAYGTGMYKVNGKTFTEYLKEPLRIKGGDIVEIIINSIDHMRHPWHLHGHSFQLISIGTGGEGPLRKDSLNNKAGRKYQSDLKYWKETGKTPMTRDSFNIPGGSYAAIRIKSDRPGFWLLHCHVEWHVSKGLGVVFHELEKEQNASDNEGMTIPVPAQETDELTSQQSELQETIPQMHHSRVLFIYFIIMICINGLLYWLLM